MMYTLFRFWKVFRFWKDGTKERLLVLLTQEEAEERCLLLNNQRLPWSLELYKYMYEVVIL